MPIYEYECQKCGERFEYLHWSGEDDKFLKCPKCGDDKPRRVVSSCKKGCADNSYAPRRFG